MIKGSFTAISSPPTSRLRPDGTVKVLDFGLAKVSEEGTSSAGNPENSPTLTMEQATRAGTLVGTAAYMAPEQARGKPVDRRADIWAFGAVLYEMLTGRRPSLQGDTVSDTLAAVLTCEPDWTRVPAGTERLLRRCLEKDSKRRLRDIGDARFFLIADEPWQARLANREDRWLWKVSTGVLAIISAMAAPVPVGTLSAATPHPRQRRG